MIFKIKWGDMRRLVERKFSPEQEAVSPIFYFEDEEEITSITVEPCLE